MNLPTHPLPRPLMALALATALAASPAAHADAERWVIDEDHFSVTFDVMHAGFARVFGMFLDAEGEFVYDEEADELHSGHVTVDSGSVFTDHEERDKHVRSDDFLAADEHPEMRFEASEYDAEAGTLTGDFTLRGTTREIELDVRINRIDEYPFGGGAFSDPPYVLGASLRGTIERSEYGMTYALEDGAVADEVDIMIEFEARRADD